jgi:hypothetical protein
MGHDFRVPKTSLGSHNSPFLMLVLSEPVKNLVIEGYGLKPRTPQTKSAFNKPLKELA